MSVKISRQAYAEMFGPTVGDKIRLADTELWIELVGAPEVGFHQLHRRNLFRTDHFAEPVNGGETEIAVRCHGAMFSWVASINIIGWRRSRF